MANVPIFMTDSRGPLDYFIWSERLFGISIDCPSPQTTFDKDSVLMFDYGGSIGARYNPAYIGWWALLNLRTYLASHEEQFLDNFRFQVEWLLKNRKEGKNKGLVWTYDFDWFEGRTFMEAPWISAMSQGLAMSCLIRAYRFDGDRGLLEVARLASKAFELKIEEGGVRTVEDGAVFYEEYPAFPIVRILDGFIFGLLGLYDLYEETRDTHIKGLFDEGVEGVKSYLSHWNYRNIWSWYGTHGFLSPPEYNKLNAVLIGVLYRITNEPSFEVFWKGWDNGQKKILQKLKTFYFLSLRNISSPKVAL
jgi:hypothetical protein